MGANDEDSASPPRADGGAEALAAHEERLRLAVSKIAERERRAYRRGISITLVSFLVGFGWLAFSAYKVKELDKLVEQRNREFAAASDSLADATQRLVEIQNKLSASI
jgi:uncharacterized membrane protein YebE (DUF533 family)